MHKTPRIIIGGVVLSSIGAFAIYRTTSAADRDATAVIASGTVEATQAELGFQASGRLETITVREGDQVTSGAQFANLDQSELLAQREVARAQVAAAQAGLSELLAGSRKEEIAHARASLAVATTKRDYAKRDVERLAPLAEQSLVSRQAYDQQRTNLSVSEGEVAKAKEDLGIIVNGIDVSTMGARFDGLYLPPPSRPDKPLAVKTLIVPTSEYVEGRNVILTTGRSVYTVALRQLVEQRAEWSWAAIQIVEKKPKEG